MIGGVVLAAGASVRMGRPKALLPYGGSTFLECILGSLDAAGIGAVRIVVGADAAAIREGFPALVETTLVRNPNPEEGMLSSVRVGVSALPEGVEAFLLWPVDHPLVRASTASALVRAWRERNAPVVLPRHRGKRGHPVLFSVETIPELLSAPDDRGARHVVEAHAGDRLEIEVSDPGIAADIDTPEAYESVFGRPIP